MKRSKITLLGTLLLCLAGIAHAQSPNSTSQQDGNERLPTHVEPQERSRPSSNLPSRSLEELTPSAPAQSALQVRQRHSISNTPIKRNRAHAREASEAGREQ